MKGIRYYQGYTIKNQGFIGSKQSWWQAVNNETGEVDFQGRILGDVIKLINESNENDIIEFLCGSAPFDGVWFGDRHPTEEGNFWWRKHLREYVDNLKKKPC